MAKSDQRTRLTKMLIRKAFTELLREKPVQNITVKELCQTAGINRGTFYSHYTDIYDLLQQIEDEITEEFQKSLQPLLEGDPSDLTPLNITAGVFACIQQNADVCAIALRPDGDRRFASQLLKIGRGDTHDERHRLSAKRNARESLTQGSRTLHASCTGKRVTASRNHVICPSVLYSALPITLAI